MEDNKLKKCPFCGGEPKLGTGRLSAWAGWSVICDNTSCRSGQYPSVQERYKLNAIIQWNTRADTQEIEQLRKELEEVGDSHKALLGRKLDLSEKCLNLEQERDELTAYVERLREAMEYSLWPALDIEEKDKAILKALEESPSVRNLPIDGETDE